MKPPFWLPLSVYVVTQKHLQVLEKTSLPSQVDYSNQPTDAPKTAGRKFLAKRSQEGGRWMDPNDLRLGGWGRNVARLYVNDSCNFAMITA